MRWSYDRYAGERAKMEARRRRHAYITQWHPYFCWLPTELEGGQMAWLETVERLYWYTGYPSNYRPYQWRFRALKKPA